MGNEEILDRPVDYCRKIETSFLSGLDEQVFRMFLLLRSRRGKPQWPQLPAHCDMVPIPTSDIDRVYFPCVDSLLQSAIEWVTTGLQPVTRKKRRATNPAALGRASGGDKHFQTRRWR